MRKLSSPAEIARRLGVEVREVRAAIVGHGIKPAARIGWAEGYDSRAEREIACAVATKDRTFTDEEVAYHEAGHGTAAHVLGVGVSGLTIEPDGRSLGSCKHKPAPDIVKRLAITCAGPLAMHIAGVPFDDAARSAHGDCDDVNRDLLAEFGEDFNPHPKPRPTGNADADRRAIQIWELQDKDRRLPRKPHNMKEFQEATILANRVVAEYWPTIAALAQALVQHRTLTGAHALHVIESTRGRGADNLTAKDAKQ